MARTQPQFFVPAEGRRQPLYSAELINRRLVYAMFSLVAVILVIVSLSVWTDNAHVGTPKDATIAFQRSLTLTGNGNAVTVLAEDGSVLMQSENGGFIAVVIDGLERARVVAQVTGNPPVTITQFENGRLSLHDPAANWTTELSSFGAGNLGVWQSLVTPQ